MARIKDVVKGQVVTVKGDITIKPGMTKPEKGEPKPYFNMSINDKSSKMYVMVWNDSPHFETMKSYSDGDFIEAEVKIEKDGSNNNPYITGFLNSIKKIEPLGVRNVVDAKSLKDELIKEWKEMKHPVMAQLVQNVLKREDVKNALYTTPNSEKAEYSFESGTLAHIIRVIRIAKAISMIYDQWEFNVDGYNTKINIDLLKTCAILHDLGTMRAFRFEGNKIVKTKEGELFEDSYLGAKILIEELPKVELLEDERILIEHCVTSSHGKLNFGALNTPRTREADAFQCIERLDTLMGKYEFSDRTSFSGEEFIKMFDKTLFLGIFDGV
jgi:Predicted HD-superfamily hydrolase